MLSASVGLTSTNGSTSASGKEIPEPSGGHAASGFPPDRSSGAVAVYGPAVAGAAAESTATVAARSGRRSDLGSMKRLLPRASRRPRNAPTDATTPAAPDQYAAATPASTSTAAFSPGAAGRRASTP